MTTTETSFNGQSKGTENSEDAALSIATKTDSKTAMNALKIIAAILPPID